MIIKPDLSKKEMLLMVVVTLAMLVYFLIGSPVMNDDGFQYEGFTESLARGHLDFKSFYGFQGLSFFSVPVYWLTHSHNSIIFTSIIFSLFSLPLAYLIGRDFYKNKKAGLLFLILFLLMPYPYTTLMRGFQEAALLFFILLIIYGSLHNKKWTPTVFAIGGIVKPFALVLFPLFLKNFLSRRRLWLLVVAFLIGTAYLGASYYQTGHLINNAAVGSYQGNFDIGNPPPLDESFNIGLKGYLRVGANLLLSFRKVMVSPLVIVLGASALLFHKSLRLRKEIMLAIILNFILVGSLTFSFSKYLLPMTTLFALASVAYILKYRWLMILVFIDSFFVFLPIWDQFGHNFWSNIYVYLVPFWLAIILFIMQNSKIKVQNDNLKS